MDSCDGHSTTEINLAYEKHEQEELWDAINKYVESCGGDTSHRRISINRMDCVVKISEAVEQMFQARLARALDFQKKLRNYS